MKGQEVEDMETNKNTRDKRKDYKKSSGRKTNGSKERYSGVENKQMGKCNDPTWYFKNPIAAKKAGSLNFTFPLGYTIDLESDLFAGNPNIGKQTFPGMMALQIHPSLPKSSDAASSVNVAAFKLYTFIRHENSGSRNYDAPDLLLYVLGVAELYAYVNWLQRTYLVVNSYSVENAYIPRTLCAMSNIDYDDVAANMADFAYQLDNRLNKLRAYRCPGDMPIFQRRAFMFKDVYIEGPNIKDQMYFFHPDAFYKFKLDEDGAGMLETVPLSTLLGTSEPAKVSDLFHGFDVLLSAISEQEDFSIMSGDILKAYGANTISVSAFDPAPSAAMAPVYNIEVLEQIKNATVYGFSSVDETASSSIFFNTSIKQDATKAFLITDPVMQVYAPKTYSNNVNIRTKHDYKSMRILTTDKLDPDATVVMENTRLMAITDLVQNASTEEQLNYIHHILCGTELVSGATIGYYNIDPTDGHKVFKSMKVSYVNAYDTTSPSEDLNEVREIDLLSHFKYAPAVHTIAVQHGADDTSIRIANAWFNFEPSEYTLVNKYSLERLHDTALLSMLNV